MVEVKISVERENELQSLSFENEEQKQKHLEKVFITKKPKDGDPKVAQLWGGGMGVDMCNSPEYSRECLKVGVIPTMSAAMPALGERKNYDKMFGTGKEKMMIGRLPFIREQNKIVLADRINKVREEVPHGIIGLNIMNLLSDYNEMLEVVGKAGRNTGKVDENGKVIREGGIDVVFVGAGMDRALGKKMYEYPHMKYVPIVSSARVAKMLMSATVDREGKEIARRPDAILLEHPNKAGGHLGRLKPTIEDIEFDPQKELLEMREYIKNIYGGDVYIPIIYAGGISNKEDIDEILAMGFDGTEFATRLLLTDESSAPNKTIREKYLTAKNVVTTLESASGFASNSLERIEGEKIVQKKAESVVKNCFAYIKRCDHLNSAIKNIHLNNLIKGGTLSEQEKETLEAGVQGSCIAEEMGKARHGIKGARLFSGKGLTVIQNDPIYKDENGNPKEATIASTIKYMRIPKVEREL